MEYNKLITDMTLGDEVEGFYVLKAAYPKTTASGKPFLSATLSDKSGAIEIKVWDYTGPIASADEGKVVKIRGNVGEYRGTPQITVDRIRLADDNDQYDLSALVPVAPIDVGTTLGELKDLIDSIEDKDYKEICKMLFAKHYDAWATIPAAKSVHHAFLNGLLMHTVSMMKIADFLAGLYGDIIDRSLLLAGTFLHDFGKQQEFSFSQLGLVTDYSVKGQLLGHLVIGAQEVAQFAARLGTPEDKQKYDAVIMAPPFGLRIDDDVIMNATKEMVRYGDLLQRKSDWFFVQHALASLSENGTGILHLPMGALFQGGKVQDIRKVFVDNGHIHSVLALPEGTVPGTSIPSALLVIGEKANDGKILFVNGSAPQVAHYFFRAKRGVTTISAEGIRELTSIILERKEVNGVSAITTVEEIAEKKYLLTPSVYTDTSDAEMVLAEPVDKICDAMLDLEQHLVLNGRELADAIQEFNAILSK